VYSAQDSGYTYGLDGKIRRQGLGNGSACLSCGSITDDVSGDTHLDPGDRVGTVAIGGKVAKILMTPWNHIEK